MKQKPKTARLQIRLKQTHPKLYIVEVWRFIGWRARARRLAWFTRWEKISETPQIPEGNVDREFSRAFRDYLGQPLTMAWDFTGAYEQPGYAEQLAEQWKKGKIRTIRGGKPYVDPSANR